MRRPGCVQARGAVREVTATSARSLKVATRLAVVNGAPACGGRAATGCRLGRGYGEIARSTIDLSTRSEQRLRDGRASELSRCHPGATLGPEVLPRIPYNPTSGRGSYWCAKGDLNRARPTLVLPELASLSVK